MKLLNFLTHQIINQNPDFHEQDFIYLQNQIINFVGLEVEEMTGTADLTAKEAIQQMTADPATQQQLFNLLTPSPTTINEQFWQDYAVSPQTATDHYHQLMINNDYLQLAQIKKNIKFQVPVSYGNLEITINLSKPEKTLAEIAAAKKAPTRTYPKCQLCFENEGYFGGHGYPYRLTHRIIRLQLHGHEFGMQYSPYEYFNEHTIVMLREHKPMQITRETFENLLDFVDLFPDYFIGSNASIPIVGGSMLSHDHYQGGKYLFAIDYANELFSFNTKNPAVTGEVLNWPVSAIKLSATDRGELVVVADRIYQSWQKYSNPALQIQAVDAAGVSHHSINPIVRKYGDTYEMIILLRDNNTSTEYPDGIFHVHPEFQHIKQENIGLIEAMGLAILPGRLQRELAEVGKYVQDLPHELAPIHQAWADELKTRYHGGDIEQFLHQEIGQVFKHILENVGVFKLNQQAQFKEFLATI